MARIEEDSQHEVGLEMEERKRRAESEVHLQRKRTGTKKDSERASHGRR